MSAKLKESLRQVRQHHQILCSRGQMDDNCLVFDEKTGVYSRLPDSAKHFFASAMDVDTEEAMLKQSERYKTAYEDGTGKKFRVLSAFRVVTVTNLMRAIGDYRPLFFNQITLNSGDPRPAYNYEELGEVKVDYVGDGGGIGHEQLSQNNKQVYPRFYQRTTAYVDHPVKDLQTGRIGDVLSKTVDLAADAAEIDDTDHQTALNNCFGAFVTTGAKLDRTYVKGRRILTTLPTTNELVAGTNWSGDANSGTSGIRERALFEVLHYCGCFGKLLDRSTKLWPTGLVLVPADEASSPLKLVTIAGTNGAVNQTAEGLLKDYAHLSYGGVDWIFVPDHTGTPGKMIPQLNMKPGDSYERVGPEWNTELIKPQELAERLEKNIESRALQFTRAIVTPVPWKPRACRVTYHS